jgi:putative FmdB family regulatory protein
MPIYEYECSECGRFEVVQKVDEKPVNKNPDCKNKDCPCKAERVMSAPSFHLKGTGWYKTDYKPSGSAGTATSSGNSTSSSKDTKSSSSDSGKSEAASTDAGDKPKKALKTTGGGGCGSGCGCH